MAAKKKKISSRKKGGSSRYAIELLILCLLLVFAGYLGNWGQDKNPPQKQTVTSKVEKKARQEQKKETSRQNAKPAPALDANEYRLSHASDGDSFELVDARNRKLRVRLYGIDAPESKQAYGGRSRSHLMKLMRGQKLLVRTMYKDNYQRSVAIVYLSRNGKADELSINQQQVQAGMAWVYDYFCTSDICNTWKLEEAMAQKQRLGLWQDSNPMPPWQWRKGNPRN